jgi:hypothetical protein
VDLTQREGISYIECGSRNGILQINPFAALRFVGGKPRRLMTPRTLIVVVVVVVVVVVIAWLSIRSCAFGLSGALLQHACTHKKNKETE